MPSKKKKYNARFPAGRIKKIMQSDEEIGKVAQAVPVIISRTLELFVESLLKQTLKITQARNAKTLSTSHMKQCIMSEQRFDFLRELVKNIPDINVAEELSVSNDDEHLSSSPEQSYPDSDTPYDLSMPSTSARATARTNGQSKSTTTRASTQTQRHITNGVCRNPLPFDAKAAMELMRQRMQASVRTHHATESVIRHTNASLLPSNEHVSAPHSLARSDSAPGWYSADLPYTSGAACQRSKGLKRTHTAALAAASAPRLKHQPQSLPNVTAVTSAAAAAKPPLNFSIDFSNKPVVNLDYSKLALPVASIQHTSPATAPTLPTPLSAPPASSSAAFNFNSTAPIINIDLSGMYTNNQSANNSVPAPVATISIGNLPPAPLPSNLSTHEVSQAMNAALKSATASCKTSAESKSSTTQSELATALAIAAARVTAATPIAASAVKFANNFFELDEDYDNI